MDLSIVLTLTESPSMQAQCSVKDNSNLEKIIVLIDVFEESEIILFNLLGQSFRCDGDK